MRRPTLLAAIALTAGASLAGRCRKVRSWSVPPALIRMPAKTQLLKTGQK